jgi:hypothetical protein
MTEFSGVGAPLSSEGLKAACDELRIGPEEIWAVLKVETSGCGFLRDRRPQILFERHVFSNRTDHKFDASNPDLSWKQSGGWGKGGAHQYDRLARASALDRKAALESASWGIGQVMGYHAKSLGFADVENMVKSMVDAEDVQLKAMFGYCKTANIDGALREHRWADFARGYNGRGFAKRAYHKKLEKHYTFFKANGTPSLRAREAQVLLRYHGFDPGPVDGVVGADTRRALRRFQRSVHLPESAQPDDRTLEALRTRDA